MMENKTGEHRNKSAKTINLLFSILLFALVGAYIGLLLYMCADNNFWGDECYSILNVTRAKTFIDIATCDSGTNPPLYFLILKGFTLLFGNKPWVYHFTSVLPMILVVLLDVFPVRKHFGKIAAVLFLIALILAPNVLGYALEVRMYAWAALFVVLCLYEGYMLILSRGEERNSWIKFCLAGIAAAYTHYFAFAAVILLYLFVFARLIVWDRKNLRKSIIAILGSILCYIPWLTVFFHSVSAVSGDFWVGNTVKVTEGFEYIFGSPYAVLFFFGLLIAMCLMCYGVIRIKKGNGKYQDDTTVWMMISAFGAVLGILVFQLVYAKLFRPVFVERYIFPASIALWMSLAIAVGTIPNMIIRRTAGLLAAAVMIAAYGSAFPGRVQSYLDDNRKTMEVYNLIRESGAPEEIYLLSDQDHLNWTVLEYYFPDIRREVFSDSKEYDLPGKNVKTAYLLLQDPLDDEQIARVEKNIGAKMEFVDRTLFASCYYISIYKATVAQ